MYVPRPVFKRFACNLCAYFTVVLLPTQIFNMTVFFRRTIRLLCYEDNKLRFLTNNIFLCSYTEVYMYVINFKMTFIYLFIQTTTITKNILISVSFMKSGYTFLIITFPSSSSYSPQLYNRYLPNQLIFFIIFAIIVFILLQNNITEVQISFE